MNQLVFIHGPGAGGCAESFVHQLKHYPGSIAPTLPGHPEGKACASVERYSEWLRGWLWSKGKQQDLVLVGFTLGGCIALQYGLDYPEEVKALVLITTGMRPRERRPGTLEFRLKAAEDPETYREECRCRQRRASSPESGTKTWATRRFRSLPELPPCKRGRRPAVLRGPL